MGFMTAMPEPPVNAGSRLTQRDIALVRHLNRVQETVREMDGSFSGWEDPPPGFADLRASSGETITLRATCLLTCCTRSVTI
jgi:hypothetical protein